MVDERVSRKQWGKLILKRKFQLPSGKIEDFFVWGGTVVPSIIFPLTKNLEVVALKQFRYGANEVVIEIPGGCPYEGETAEEIARKELEEETGFTAEKFLKLGSTLLFEPAACITPYMPILATGCRKVCEPHLDQTEFAETILFSLSEWVGKIRSGEIRDSKTIAITFLALFQLGFLVSV
jgi:8-oxo-dGTP pyrophosphatase MutT (NUDIX family)